jgi:hypothetical protein
VNNPAAIAAVVTDNKADNARIIWQFSSLVEPGGAATQKSIALKDVMSSWNKARY